jgi:hypothetical protein
MLVQLVFMERLLYATGGVDPRQWFPVGADMSFD